jgi:hypothetical protein
MQAAAKDLDPQVLTIPPDLPGSGTGWFTSADEKTALGILIIAATEAFITDPQQSGEAFGWFRNNRDDIDEHRDGPTLDAQGLSPVTLTLAKLLPASSRTGGDAFWLDQTRTVHTATDTDGPATRLTAGRALQRIHLAATTLGLGSGHGRETRQVIADNWLQDLLSALGGFELLMAVSAGEPAIVAVGVLGGLALLVAPWTPRGRLPAVLLLIGTVPFAALTWWSLVSPLLAVLALVLGFIARGRPKWPPPSPGQALVSCAQRVSIEPVARASPTWSM